VRVLFAHWVERVERDQLELVSEARVQPVDSGAGRRLRVLWALVGPFDGLVGTEALNAAAQLDEARLDTLDVGAGTGFATEGVIAHVDAARVTMLDQSPDQLRRAQAKPALAACRNVLGDAEDLPFPDDAFDRYVSCGSIEYWPDPERAIREAHRVLRPGAWQWWPGHPEPTSAPRATPRLANRPTAGKRTTNSSPGSASRTGVGATSVFHATEHSRLRRTRVRLCARGNRTKHRVAPVL
jgi:SAM-dependent methyltransferase